MRWFRGSGRLAACVVLIGCGRVGFDPRSNDGSAGGDGSLSQDAGFVSYDSIDPRVPFGSPTNIGTGLTADLESDDPTLTADELLLVFEVDDPDSELYEMRRASRTDPWSTAAPIAALNTNRNEATPELDPAGTAITWSRENPGSIDAFRSTRPDRDAAWSSPQPWALFANDGLDETSVTISFDGLEIVAAFGPDGSRDLVHARRASLADEFTTIAMIAELSSAADESGPHLSGDGLAIYFARDGITSDLYVATRPSRDALFGAPERIAELDTGADEQSPWISPDGRTIYFASNISGRMRLYTASR